jgi:hypothetical protein
MKGSSTCDIIRSVNSLDREILAAMKQHRADFSLHVLERNHVGRDMSNHEHVGNGKVHLAGFPIGEYELKQDSAFLG